MSKDTIDSSDDEEDNVIRKIRSGYFPYIVDNLIDIKAILITDAPDVELDYRLGMTLQHISDRFFRHTELGRRYKELKTKFIAPTKEQYDQFVEQAISFFTSQEAIIIDNPIEPTQSIQLFNHLFSDKVPLPPTIHPTANDLSYREELLRKIHTDQDFIRIINQIFPVNILSLVQSDTSENAAELLAFSKAINRYIKNELKAMLSNSVDSIEVDKFIQLKFHHQVIRDLNESWILRPQTKKAQNKIDSLGNYVEIFKELTQDNKVSVIKRIFDLLNNRETEVIEIKDAQYADKLVQLLFVSEIARNKAAIFSTLMFLELLQVQDISDNSTKERLIKLFPMTAKGAMQSSRDLIDETRLENTHYMDFNHEGRAHINILRAQGELWRYFDTSLEVIRKLIILLDKNSCEVLKPTTFIEHIISTEKFWSQESTIELIVRAKDIKQSHLHLSATKFDEFDQKKQYLKNHFLDTKQLELIDTSTERTIGRVIDRFFNEQIEELRLNYIDQLVLDYNLTREINSIIEKSIIKLYQHVTSSYGIQFDTNQFQLTSNVFDETNFAGNENMVEERKSDSEIMPSDSKKAKIDAESSVVITTDDSAVSARSNIMGESSAADTD